MPEGADGAREVLRLQDVHAFYGESHILHGVDLGVREGEVVTLLGRNGAGKTTTLRSIMGILEQRTGSIRFDGHELIGLASNRVAKLGLAYCPEERGIFASLDVEENLMLPPVVKQGGMALDEIYRLFPNLQERRRSQGTRLSGGEQQMLAIARILRTGAKLLLLDEPTEGLAPVHRAADRRGDSPVETAWFHRAAGRAELLFRLDRRRPPLPHGARAGR